MQCLGKALTGEGARCGVESAEKHTLVIDSFLRQCLLSLQSVSVSRRFLSSFLLCPLLYIYCSVAHMHLHSAFGYCILCNQSLILINKLCFRYLTPQTVHRIHSVSNIPDGVGSLIVCP